MKADTLKRAKEIEHDINIFEFLFQYSDKSKNPEFIMKHQYGCVDPIQTKIEGTYTHLFRQFFEQQIERLKAELEAL